ncbi:hypothetical protein COMA2_10167 [Candidatus Nitrospira nitrificans]|uniref:Uncharacterized protein n=1 Tax=Candidatus Nitrospira nitrificans TaxID=1742973 RepID=A0A0S4L6N4_9BACT|nr:hypothetical protein COMA2_10167 [Candidatus Nitrospira nitrificans]
MGRISPKRHRTMDTEIDRLTALVTTGTPILPKHFLSIPIGKFFLLLPYVRIAILALYRKSRRLQWHVS